MTDDAPGRLRGSGDGFVLVQPIPPETFEVGQVLTVGTLDNGQPSRWVVRRVNRQGVATCTPASEDE